MSTLFEDLLFMAEPSYEDYFNLDSLGTRHIQEHRFN